MRGNRLKLETGRENWRQRGNEREKDKMRERERDREKIIQ